jgi:hypothetical protein
MMSYSRHRGMQLLQVVWCNVAMRMLLSCMHHMPCNPTVSLQTRHPHSAALAVATPSLHQVCPTQRAMCPVT